MISTASGQATCHSVSMIDSSTPSSANDDPTDRSMPPVMMTSPRPRLKIPNAPIRRAVFCRLAGDRNRGLSAVTIAHSTTSSRNVASSFFTSGDPIAGSRQTRPQAPPPTSIAGCRRVHPRGRTVRLACSVTPQGVRDPAQRRRRSRTGASRRRVRRGHQQVSTSRHLVHHRRADEVAAETGRPQLDTGITVPRADLVVTAGAEQQTKAVMMTPLSSPGAPVPVMPRAASSGSSPKPMRHLMAGTFRWYFTIDVTGGAIRFPTVLYSLITGRSYCRAPSGYGGGAPRPRRPAFRDAPTRIPRRR